MSDDSSNTAPTAAPTAAVPTAAAPPSITIATAPAQERQTAFSADYVKDLREEIKGYRVKATEQQNRAEAAEAAAIKAKEDTAEALKAAHEKAAQAQAEIEDRARRRLIHAEAKAAAIKAGMIDLDGLKLADMSLIRINDDGEAEGADDLIAALKEAKSYLFTQNVVGSSNPAPAPKPSPTSGNLAARMTSEDWKDVQRKIKNGRSVVRA